VLVSRVGGCAASHRSTAVWTFRAGVLMTDAGVTALSSPQSRVDAALYRSPAGDARARSWALGAGVRVVHGSAGDSAARPRVSVRACGDLFRAMGEVAEQPAPLVRARDTADAARDRPVGRRGGRRRLTAPPSAVPRFTPVVQAVAGRARVAHPMPSPPLPVPGPVDNLLHLPVGWRSVAGARPRPNPAGALGGSHRPRGLIVGGLLSLKPCR
jgi:hypothetical protein